MIYDTKDMIARAVETLLLEKKVKKLTVKDIVNECQITRQTFYYHFTDIPDLARWVVLQKKEEAMAEYKDIEHIEDQIRYWVLVAVNAKPYIKKSMESNYASEFQQIVFKAIEDILFAIAQEDVTFRNLDSFEKDLWIRYNCHAVIGLMGDWSEMDMENVDRVVHSIYLFVTRQLISEQK